MRRVLAGIGVGLLLSAPVVDAFRITSPPRISEWNPSTMTQLNLYLQDLWELSKGRMEWNTVTSDPDGTLPGDQGQPVFYDTSTNQICINVDGAKDWDCVNLTP